MGFNAVGQVELPVKKKRGKSEPKETPRIFDQYQAKQADRLQMSIEHCEGRYGRGERLDKNYGSMNWRVQLEGNEVDQQNDPDTLALFFKIGTKKWAIMGKDQNEIEQYCESQDLEANLRGMKDYIEGLKEDSADGQLFLTEVKRVCKIKAKYDYNEATGRMDLNKP